MSICDLRPATQDLLLVSYVTEEAAYGVAVTVFINEKKTPSYNIIEKFGTTTLFIAIY